LCNRGFKKDINLNFNFSWKSFFIAQSPPIFGAIVILVLFIAFPAQPEHYGSRDLVRRVMPYVTLSFPLFYIPYFLYRIFGPGKIKIDLDNKKAFYGNKPISLNKVRKIYIKKNEKHGTNIHFYADKVILRVSSWYKTRSIESELLKIESYCLSNNIQLESSTVEEKPA